MRRWGSDCKLNILNTMNTAKPPPLRSSLFAMYSERLLMLDKPRKRVYVDVPMCGMAVIDLVI